MTVNDRALDGATMPFSPVTLVLARDPRVVDDLREMANALDELAEGGHKEEAHRLADPLIRDPRQRSTLAVFYLRELAGRRGARLLLRWLRADEGQAERVFVARANPAVRAWAQFYYPSTCTWALRALDSDCAPHWSLRVGDGRTVPPAQGSGGVSVPLPATGISPWDLGALPGTNGLCTGCSKLGRDRAMTRGV